jgi:hypothetical protein
VPLQFGFVIREIRSTISLSLMFRTVINQLIKCIISSTTANCFSLVSLTGPLKLIINHNDSVRPTNNLVITIWELLSKLSYTVESSRVTKLLKKIFCGHLKTKHVAESINHVLNHFDVEGLFVLRPVVNLNFVSVSISGLRTKRLTSTLNDIIYYYCLNNFLYRVFL